MENEKRSILGRITNMIRFLFWAIVVIVLIHQITAPNRVDSARADVLQRFQEQRKSRVIAMIHRQDNFTLLGVPIQSYINIEDSEAILRAIRLTPQEKPIDLILHTPGGLVLAAEQIAKALAEHQGKVTVFVPHYAMSGGTMLALAADEIVMDPNAVLGPVDPQLGDMPAASILKVLETKPVSKVSDETIEMADMAAKAQLQVAEFVNELLQKNMPKEKSEKLAVLLTEGRWTHDFPITVEMAHAMGLKVSVNMPPIIYELMDLYPQNGAGRPSVEYVPLHRTPNPTNQREVPNSK